ncbi:MAG: exo-alpha-sialidase [Anaerolineales bacterium]
MRFRPRLSPILLITAGCLLLAACGPRLAGSPTPASGSAPAILGQVIQQVQWRASAAAAFQPAAAGTPLSSGSQLKTLDASQARVDLQAGGLLRLAPNTELTLANLPAPGGDPAIRVRLLAGKVWSGLPGGGLIVSTPMGVVNIHANRASLEFVPGHAGDPADDVMIATCLDGDCIVQTEALRENLSSMQQVVITGGSQIARFSLDAAALQDFLAQNPESAALPVPASTPVTATVQAATLPAATQPGPNTPTAPPVATTAAPPTPPPSTATVAPGGVLGQHVVQDGETIYCIGRGYGVLPEAIIESNGLTPPFAIAAGQVLAIPAVPWEPSDGPRCAPQFPPLSGGAPAPAATPAAPVGTPAAAELATAISAPPISAATGAPAATAGPTFIPPSTWAQPVNLSQSSAASLPALAAASVGNFYALWWDHFAGSLYAVYRPDSGWSSPIGAPVIAGAMPVPGASPTPVSNLPSPPADLRLFAASDRPLYAMWMTSDGYLAYSQNPQPASGGAWTSAITLTTGLLAWDAVLGPDGTLHLAYLQSGQSSAGVYYQRLAPGAVQWDPPAELFPSLYFRTLPAGEAHISVAAGEAGQVYVGWDDPQLFYSVHSHSGDSGLSWEAPVPVADPNSLSGDLPRRVRFLPVPGGAWLRLWESSVNCALYQQPLAGDGLTWGPPVRVFEGLTGCLGRLQTYPLPNGQMALWGSLRAPGSPSVVALWDGQRWSEPWLPHIGFINPATNRPAGLDCLQGAVSGELLVALGCDARGDVWATVSQVGIRQLLPPGVTDWSPLQAVSAADAEAGLPALAAGADGKLHAAWAQADPVAPGDQPIFYARRGEDWTPPVPVLRLAEGGPSNAPALSVDPRGWLHAVWSGGPNGQIYYSRSFLRDSVQESGWSPPILLPSLQPAGSSPALNLDAAGTLRVAYTIPLNEDRGVYLTESGDQGQTWSEPRQAFNAAAAGWAAVQDTQLAVDRAGGLHLMVVRGSLPPATVPLGIYYLRSSDGGQTWTQPELVGSGATGFPRLAATGNGQVHRLWVQPGSEQTVLWHQWSADGGQSWSAAAVIAAPPRLEPRLGLASDSSGILYLTGIEAGPRDSASLFYLRWDGAQWIASASLSLGYAADAGSSTAALLLPGGRLAVLARVTSFAALASGLHVLAYTERRVPVEPAPAVTATVSPSPTVPSGQTPAVTSAPPTLTPIPTVDPGAAAPAPASDAIWLRVGLILAAMFLIVLLAFTRLRRSRRER